jgi:hypothetical protein
MARRSFFIDASTDSDAPASERGRMQGGAGRKDERLFQSAMCLTARGQA